LKFFGAFLWHETHKWGLGTSIPPCPLMNSLITQSHSSRLKKFVPDLSDFGLSYPLLFFFGWAA